MRSLFRADVNSSWGVKFSLAFPFLELGAVGVHSSGLWRWPRCWCCFLGACIRSKSMELGCEHSLAGCERLPSVA